MPTPLVRAKMTVASTPGLGAIVLGVPYEAGVSFDAAGVNNGDVLIYAVYDGSSFEQGQGTYTTSTHTLTRDTVVLSSNNNLKVDLGPNTIVYGVAVISGSGGGTSGGGFAPAGSDGDIQVRHGSGVSAIDRSGGIGTDYLGRDNNYRAIPVGGGVGGTYNISGGNPVFPTYADAHTAVVAGTIAPGVHSFWTSGFYNPGDNGGSFYVDVGAVDIANDPTVFNTYPISALTITEPAVIHDTTNNRYFLMTPKNGEVWVEQFGARAAGWQTRGNDLTPFLYKAQRYCIRTNFYNKQWGTNVIRIGPGFWYQASTYNIKGMLAHVKGCGTFTYLQPELGVSGISICYQWSFDGNAVNGWNPNQTINWITTLAHGRNGRVSANGNVYEQTVAGTTAATGVGPTGTGSDIVDGTVHWKYIRPLVPDEDYNGTTDGGGSIIEDLNIYSLWNRATDPYGLACGIISSARGTYRNIISDNMSGHGLAFIANGDPSFPFCSGNCDGFRVENCTEYYNGWSGVRVGGSIGNAGHIIGNDASTNGWFSIDDATFLQNTIVEAQSAYDGRPDYNVKQHPGQVEFNGYYYTARIPILGIEGDANYRSPAPDVSSWWILSGGDGTWPADTNHPAWSNTGTYEPGGAYCGHHFNSRSTWLGLYVEGGTMPSQFGPNHLVLSGALNNTSIPPYQGLFISDNVWSGGRGGHSALSSHQTTPHLSGFKDFWSDFGAKAGGLDKTLAQWLDFNGNFIWWGGTSDDQITHVDYPLEINNNVIMRMLGQDTARSFGGSQPRPFTMQFPRIIIGDDANGIEADAGVAPPTSGYFPPGFRRFNKNYVPGGPSEWACPAGGTPGVWYALVPSNTVGSSFNFFNPADKGSGIVLSNANLTATKSGSGFFSVRAVTPWTSGKHYAEFTLTALAGFAAIGLADASETLTNYTGNDGAATVLYNTNGGGSASEVKRNGSILATGAVLATSNVVGLLYDAATQQMWVTVNGTVMFGDPVAGTGGVTAPYPNAYPIFGTDNSTIVTANYGGSSWAHTPPTGFS